MTLARDLMKFPIPSLSFDMTVSDALTYFQQSGTDFAVVMASKDRLQGIISESNLIKLFLRFNSQRNKEEIILYRDCLSPVQLVQETEDLSAVIQKVMMAIGHRVIVINNQGEAVGYIGPKEILTLLNGDSIRDKGKPLSPDQSSQLYIYESFFTHSPFMMHSVNPHGFIQMANEILHRALGYEHGELIGKTIFDLYSQKHHDQAQTGIQKIITHGYHKTIKTEMLKKDGSILKVELASKLLEDPWKNPLGTMTVSRALDMDEYLTLES